MDDTSTIRRFIDWGIDRLYMDSADPALMLFGVDPREGPRSPMQTLLRAATATSRGRGVG